MSGTIILIVEGQLDGEIVKIFVRRKYPQVQVSIRKATGSKPNLSHLAEQLEELIQSALYARKRGDCIAVLHDADLQTRPHDRNDYEQIKRICGKYNSQVVHVIAHDEIEAWLLADEGLCKRLNINAENWDNRRKPSDSLATLLDKANLPRYRAEHLDKIFVHLSDNSVSPSLREALKHLENAPCTKP